MRPDVWRTLCELMEDWGVSPPDVSVVEERGSVWAANEEGTRALLVYVVKPGEKEGAVVAEVQRALAEDVVADTQRAVVVVPGVNKLARLRRIPNAQVWDAADLRVNLARHQLVPACRALSPAEAEALFKLAPKSILQPLPRSDLVVRYHGFVAGEVVQFTRQTEVGRDTKYRVVVDTFY